MAVPMPSAANPSFRLPEAPPDVETAEHHEYHACRYGIHRIRSDQTVMSSQSRWFRRATTRGGRRRNDRAGRAAERPRPGLRGFGSARSSLGRVAAPKARLTSTRRGVPSTDHAEEGAGVEMSPPADSYAKPGRVARCCGSRAYSAPREPTTVLPDLMWDPRCARPSLAYATLHPTLARVQRRGSTSSSSR